MLLLPPESGWILNIAVCWNSSTLIWRTRRASTSTRWVKTATSWTWNKAMQNCSLVCLAASRPRVGRRTSRLEHTVFQCSSSSVPGSIHKRESSEHERGPKAISLIFDSWTDSMIQSESSIIEWCWLMLTPNVAQGRNQWKNQSTQLRLNWLNY